MTTITLRTIDLTNTSLFPVDKTLIGFLQIKIKGKRGGALDAWIEELKIRFPRAVGAIDSKSSSSEVDVDLKKLRGGVLATDTLLKTCFNHFNIEADILNEAKPATIDQINELLKEREGDSDIIKLLKAVANEQAETYKAIFDSWELGVSGLIFTADSIKNFYLNYLPNTYLAEKLNPDPVIKISDLDQDQAKQLLGDVFATLYSGYIQLEQDSDLEGFQKGINDNLEKLKKLINDTRDSKKPKEDVEAIKKENSDLKEAWRKNFADRGLGEKEYLKDKEISVKAINEVGWSLKVYDDVFSYRDKSMPQDIRTWWTGTKMYWQNNFANKPDIKIYGKGIEGKELDDETLKIINLYIQSLQSDLRDYHKSFDGVNESPVKVGEWWEALEGAWNAYKFNEKYGKIDFDSLGKIKKDLGTGDNGAELKDLYDYIDAVLDKQAQLPVYILTEEPEEISKPKIGGDKPNPNYITFEQELINHPLIKDKIQEKINKRKFSTPIAISKDKPTKPDTSTTTPQPTPEQISKANQYDAIASIFPGGKVPDNLKEQWTNLNNRPNITQEEYNQLKARAEANKPDPVPPSPPKTDSEVVKENEKLWNHVDNLTKIIEKTRKP